MVPRARGGLGGPGWVCVSPGTLFSFAGQGGPSSVRASMGHVSCVNELEKLLLHYYFVYE